MAKKLPIPLPATGQPYYLQRAHIKDFYSIHDAVVEFEPGLNIIIGDNGSGKTNFIKCIESVLTSPKYDFNGKVELTIIGEDILQVEAARKDNSNDDIFNAIGLNRTKAQTTITVTSQNTTFQEESFQKAQYQLLAHKRDNSEKITIFKLITLTHGIPSEYSIVKQPIDFQASANGGAYSISRDSQFADSLAANISSALLYTYQSLKGKEIVPTQQQITAAIEKVESSYTEYLLPNLRLLTSIADIRFTDRYSLYGDSSNHQTVVKAFRMEFKVGNDWLPFSALSSGTQRMFYLISEITASSLYFSNRKGIIDDTSSIIIQVEEPELGIHPDQLEKLLVFLREQSQKHQIIITTHSPQVLDMLNNDELNRITICELDKKKGTQFLKLKRTQVTAAQKYMRTQGLYLSDYWRYGSLESTH